MAEVKLSNVSIKSYE